MLSLGALFIVAGRVGDIVGRRRAFVFGCVLFTATMIGAALAPNLAALVTFRVLQGAGAGLLSRSASRWSPTATPRAGGPAPSA